MNLKLILIATIFIVLSLTALISAEETSTEKPKKKEGDSCADEAECEDELVCVSNQ